MKLPESFRKVIEGFEMYPGIGPKTAERLAYHTILKLSKEEVLSFCKNLEDAINNIRYCSICGSITENEICDICCDDTRNNVLLIVEGSKDVNVLEKTQAFNGKYHVLNGAISVLNGIGPDNINLETLKERIEKEKIKEVIIATSSTIEGEMTALYIKKMLEDNPIEVYRIGYGLPAGADIEYADEITLIKALEGKRKI